MSGSGTRTINYAPPCGDKSGQNGSLRNDRLNFNDRANGRARKRETGRDDVNAECGGANVWYVAHACTEVSVADLRTAMECARISP